MRSLSFTPGFSPLISADERCLKPFYRFVLSSGPLSVKARKQHEEKPLKRFLQHSRFWVTGLKPGVNDRWRFHTFEAKPIRLDVVTKYIHVPPAHVLLRATSRTTS